MVFSGIMETAAGPVFCSRPEQCVSQAVKFTREEESMLKSENKTVPTFSSTKDVIWMCLICW